MTLQETKLQTKKLLISQVSDLIKEHWSDKNNYLCFIRPPEVHLAINMLGGAANHSEWTPRGCREARWQLAFPEYLPLLTFASFAIVSYLWLQIWHPGCLLSSPYTLNLSGSIFWETFIFWSPVSSTAGVASTSPLSFLVVKKNGRTGKERGGMTKKRFTRYHGDLACVALTQNLDTGSDIGARGDQTTRCLKWIPCDDRDKYRRGSQIPECQDR